MHISVDLLKGTYYLNGETLIAEIVFQLKPPDDPKDQNKLTTLAWACSQIHCECTFNLDKVKFTSKNEKQLPKLGLTSLVPNYGEKGICVYASKPKILVCDLVIEYGQKYKFLYEEAIPFEAFPSYRGIICKYAYKLTISAQYLSSPVSFVRIPFKVLVLQGLSQEIMSNDSENATSPVNPFLKDTEKSEKFSMEKAMAFIQDIVSFRNIRHFNITVDNDKVCKLSINKTFYKLGEAITIYLDFADSTLTCLEVYTSLREEEEIIEDEHILKLKSVDSQSSGGAVITTGLYSEKRHFLINSLFTPITMDVPYFVAPTFTTNTLKHSWKIHFEFTFSPLSSPLYNKKVSESQSNGEQNLISLPAQIIENVSETKKLEQEKDDVMELQYDLNLKSCSLSRPCLTDVETMTWDLPIKIFPTNPVFISSQYTTGKITTNL